MESLVVLPVKGAIWLAADERHNLFLAQPSQVLALFTALGDPLGHHRITIARLCDDSEILFGDIDTHVFKHRPPLSARSSRN